MLNVIAILVTFGVTTWLVGVFMLRLIWVSLATFTIVTLLLAGQGQQDPMAPVGLGAFAAAFWLAWQLLHRARYGWWRSRRAEAVFGRHGVIRHRLGVGAGGAARGGGGRVGRAR